MVTNNDDENMMTYHFLSGVNFQSQAFLFACDYENKLARLKKYGTIGYKSNIAIDLLAIQQKSLDRALFLYIFIRVVRSSGIRASISIAYIRKFYKM